MYTRFSGRRYPSFLISVVIATFAFSPARLVADRESSLLRGCMLALSLLASGVPQGQGPEYYRRPIDPNIVQVPAEASNPKKKRVVALTSNLTKANVDYLFAHQYNEHLPKIRGAKGLVFHGFDGRLHVVMWQTGQGRSDHGVHHTDVAASILRHEARLLREAAEGAVLELEYGSGRSALRRDSSLRYEKMAVDLEALADKLHDQRNHHAMPEALLQRFQGFQLSAQVGRDGKVQGVTKLEISSRITAAQASKGVVLEAEVFNKKLEAIYAALPPELRRWKRVEVEGWDELEFDDKRAVVEPGTTRPPLKLVRATR